MFFDLFELLELWSCEEKKEQSNTFNHCCQLPYLPLLSPHWPGLHGGFSKSPCQPAPVPLCVRARAHAYMWTTWKKVKCQKCPEPTVSRAGAKSGPHCPLSGRASTWHHWHWDRVDVDFLVLLSPQHSKESHCKVVGLTISSWPS